METSLDWIGIACVSGAVLSLLAAVKNFWAIRTASLAVEAGEILPVSAQGRSLPFGFLFQQNAVPVVEASRRRLVRAIATSLWLCATAVTVTAANCAEPATSMDEPWFWLATLAVLATLFSRGNDFTLPIRKKFGYVAITVAAAMAAAHLYLYGLYENGLPRLAQPATGNLIPFHDNGMLVFISPSQSATLIWLQFGAVLLALCGAIIVRYAGGTGERTQ